MITPGRAVAPESSEHKKYEHLIASTEDLQPHVTAVAHPCDKNSLKGALETSRAHAETPPSPALAKRDRRSGSDTSARGLSGANHRNLAIVA
jgi:phosphate acetyltransferase